MTEKEINIDLPTDSDGFLPRQCPNCEKKFAIQGESYEEEHYLNLRCPYCEWIAEFDDFLTEEQAQYAEAVAENEARKMAEKEVGKALEDAFSGFKSNDSVEVETSTDDIDFGHREPPSPHLPIATQEVSCSECSFSYIVRTGTSDHTCPVCRD